jgi:Protein of unknown function (DUF1559)
MSVDRIEIPTSTNKQRPPLRWWQAVIIVAGTVCLLAVVSQWDVIRETEFEFPEIVVVPDNDASIDVGAWHSEVAQGLLSFHDVYGKLPPAVITEKEGHPLFSWRVLLAPFVSSNDVWKRFNMDRPWDSPENLPLLAEMPRCFGSRFSDPPGTTRCKVFVGPGTPFEGAGTTLSNACEKPGITLASFTDGAGFTLLVIEAGDPVPWTKPEDFAYGPAIPLPQLGEPWHKPVYFGQNLRNGLEIGRRPFYSACFADGAHRFLRASISEPTLRALITRNGGERVDLSELQY